MRALSAFFLLGHLLFTAPTLADAKLDLSYGVRYFGKMIAEFSITESACNYGRSVDKIFQTVTWSSGAFQLMAETTLRCFVENSHALIRYTSGSAHATLSRMQFRFRKRKVENDMPPFRTGEAVLEYQIDEGPWTTIGKYGDLKGEYSIEANDHRVPDVLEINLILLSESPAVSNTATSESDVGSKGPTPVLEELMHEATHEFFDPHKIQGVDLYFLKRS